jgi:hypothetical protein
LDDNPADWHFLLDADDEMAPGAFSLVDLAAPATFGAVCLNGHITPLQAPLTKADLFRLGAYSTLSMGCFVRGDLGLRFNPLMDLAEDFDFYARLPGFTKRREPLVSIGYSRPSSIGPRGTGDVDWVSACADVLARYAAANGSTPELRLLPDGNYDSPTDPGEVGYEGQPRRRSVTQEEADVLLELGRDRVVFEIGTGLAVSTRALAVNARWGMTVDPDPWVHDPHIPNILFRRDRPTSLGTFDLAFIDGHHSTEAVLADIAYCASIPLLVLHDTYLPEVQAAIALSALRERKIYPTRCRLAIYTAPGMLS